MPFTTMAYPILIRGGQSFGHLICSDISLKNKWFVTIKTYSNLGKSYPWLTATFVNIQAHIILPTVVAISIHNKTILFSMIWSISNLVEVCVKKYLCFYMFNHNFLLMTLISEWYSFLRKLTFNSVTYYLQYPLTQTLFYIVPSPCQVSIFTISKYQCSNSNYLHNIHIYLFVFLG